YFSKRRVLLAGLIIYVAGGAGGGISNSIYTLLGFRALLGLGVGMVMPFSTALISDLFEGADRARLMGLSSSSNMLGGMLALLFSGFLASFSWRFPFAIYFFAIPVFLMNFRYLPEPPENEILTDKGKLQTRVYWLALAMFLLNLTFYVLPLTMALFITEQSLGSPGICGLAIAFSTAGGFLAGLCFQKIRELTRSYHVSLMLGIMSAGFLLLYYSYDIFTLFLGAGLIGFANRSIYPLVFLKATLGIDRTRSVRVTATLSGMIYLGQFISPLFILSMGHLLGNTSLRFNYLIIGMIIFTGLLGSLVYIFLFSTDRKVREKG
nr:MFS transporter [Synergistales bacterium]